MKTIKFILCLLCISGNLLHAELVKGRLTKATPVPIMFNGKQMGEATLPIGSAVTVMQTNGTKSLIHTATGDAWINSENIQLDAVKVVANPTPAQVAPTPTLVANPVAPATSITTQTNPENKPTEILHEIPTDFQWNQSVIIPGKFVFLALPFERQKDNCLAAAAYNVLKYQKPELQVTQDELYKMFTSKTSGGVNERVMAVGIYNLGFSAEWRPREASFMINELNHNRPLIGGMDRHAFTIIGYDAKDNTFIAWDQRGRGISLPNMKLPGTFKVDSKMLARFSGLCSITKSEKEVQPEEEATIAKLGNTGKLEKHLIIHTNRPNEGSFEYATEQAIKCLVRQHQKVIIPMEKDNFVIVEAQTAENDRHITVTSTKTNKTSRTTFTSLAKQATETAQTGQPGGPRKTKTIYSCEPSKNQVASN